MKRAERLVDVFCPFLFGHDDWGMSDSIIDACAIACLPVGRLCERKEFSPLWERGVRGDFRNDISFQLHFPAPICWQWRGWLLDDLIECFKIN